MSDIKQAARELAESLAHHWEFAPKPSDIDPTVPEVEAAMRRVKAETLREAAAIVNSHYPLAGLAHTFDRLAREAERSDQR